MVAQPQSQQSLGERWVMYVDRKSKRYYYKGTENGKRLWSDNVDSAMQWCSYHEINSYYEDNLKSDFSGNLRFLRR